MKIQQATLQMGSASSAYRHEERQQRVTAMQVRSQQTLQPLEQSSVDRSSVDISGQARSAQSPAESSSRSASTVDPRMQMLVDLVEALTGEPVRLFNPASIEHTAVAASNTATSRANTPDWSFQIATHSVREEAESVSFTAQGEVATADGRSITFSLALNMQRYEREETVSITTGSTARKQQQDPLVLNLTSDQARLQSDTMSFDLNADGSADQIARLAAGSGYLVLDRNGNGSVDDGRELFGPGSGDGFTELAMLDGDKNGWIDENDAAYTKLQVWQPGSAAISLKDAGVGAIALAHNATPFTLKSAGSELGAVRSSGIFLGEDGSAHTVQQIDLVT